MKFDQRGDINVGYAIAIGHAKRFVLNEAPNASQASTSLRLLAGVDQRDVPRFR